MKNNKLTLSIVVIGAGLFLGACTHQPEESPSENTAQTKEIAPAGNISDVSTLEQLGSFITAGRSIHCNVTDTADPDFSAEYYFMDGQMKVTSMDSGNTSHFLSMDNTGYLWMEGEAQGYTYTYEPDEELSERLENYREQIPTLEEEAEVQNTTVLDCEPASLSDADFSLPENVEFISPSEMMEQAFEEANNNAEENGQAPPQAMPEMTEEEQQTYQDIIDQYQNQNQ